MPTGGCPDATVRRRRRGHIMNVTVLGAGSWGTTVAAIVSKRTPTTLWARNEGVARQIDQKHVNPRYLEGFDLPESLRGTSDLAEGTSRADAPRGWRRAWASATTRGPW